MRCNAAAMAHAFQHAQPGGRHALRARSIIIVKEVWPAALDGDLRLAALLVADLLKH